MKIQILKDYEALSQATARLISEAVTTKPNALICLASGHTPIGVFQELAREVNANKLDLSGCTFLSLDEWIGIDPNDSGSCLTMLKKDCFEPLRLQPHQTEYFNVQIPDLQKECDRINSLIEKNGGLDIMLVGVGTNGHIGMNEPGTSFDSYAHTGPLAEETKMVGQKYFSKPTTLSTGITLGLRHLREARLPIIMASGEKKAAIIAKGLTQTPNEAIPLSIAQLITHGYIMLDEEAAKQLTDAR
jgi:glucosamine-6-phosphate isomerase